MKTLIFCGSPRPRGETASALSFFREALGGEIVQFDAYQTKVTPCVDCRYCWEHPGCAVRDGMDEIYEKIAWCDGIVIASPVYFSTLTPPMMGILSRLQTFFCARAFRGEILPREKTGGVILVGGGNGSPGPALDAAKAGLRLMGVGQFVPPAVFHNTDKVRALSDPEFVKALSDGAALMRQLVEEKR